MRLKLEKSKLNSQQPPHNCTQWPQLATSGENKCSAVLGSTTEASLNGGSQWPPAVGWGGSSVCQSAPGLIRLNLFKHCPKRGRKYLVIAAHPCLILYLLWGTRTTDSFPRSSFIIILGWKGAVMSKYGLAHWPPGVLMASLHPVWMNSLEGNTEWIWLWEQPSASIIQNI